MADVKIYEEGITKKEFEKVINENSIVMVDIYTTWCGPCKRMKPIFEELASEFTNVKFISFDLDQTNWIRGTEYDTTAIPTFLFIKKGKLIHKRIGGLFKDAFSKMIKEKLID